MFREALSAWLEHDNLHTNTWPNKSTISFMMLSVITFQVNTKKSAKSMHVNNNKCLTCLITNAQFLSALKNYLPYHRWNVELENNTYTDFRHFAVMPRQTMALLINYQYLHYESHNTQLRNVRHISLAVQLGACLFKQEVVLLARSSMETGR